MRKHQAATQWQKFSDLFVAARQLDAEGIDMRRMGSRST
jgi:hypothetical protein